MADPNYQLIAAGATARVASILTDVELRRDQVSRALRAAANHGHVAAVRLLLAAGADVHDGHEDALLSAVLMNHVEVVGLLIAAGANVNAAGGAPLCNAAAFGHVDVVRQLLGAGADVHANQDTPLRQAAAFNRVDVVPVLLAAGADPHANNDAALCEAALNGHTAVIRCLLVAGADPVTACVKANRTDRQPIVMAIEACADVLTHDQRQAIAARSRHFVGLRAAARASRQHAGLQR